MKGCNYKLTGYVHTNNRLARTAFLISFVVFVFKSLSAQVSTEYLLYHGKGAFNSTSKSYEVGGQPFTGIDTMEERSDTLYTIDSNILLTAPHQNKTMGIGYFNKGKITKFIEEYKTDSKAHAKRIELVYDTNGKILDGVYSTWGPDGALLFENEYENGTCSGFDIALNNGHVQALVLQASRVSKSYTFYSNGQVESEIIPIYGNEYCGKYKKRTWYRNGRRESEEEVMYDTISSIYYDTIKQRIIKHYSRFPNHLLDGEHSEWYENGQLKEYGEVDSGYNVGTWYYYYEDGQLRKETIYNNTTHKIEKTLKFNQKGEAVKED